MDDQLRIILIIIFSVSIFGLITFVLVKNYQSNNGLECKNIAFKKKTKLSRSDLGTNIELDLCKRNNKYQLVSINISK